MDLKTYISTSPRGTAKKLAETLGVSKSYLSQMASRACSISPRRCREIETATAGAVTRKDLRPSDWREIWRDDASNSDSPAIPTKEAA
ncbi:transcriptional regulator [Paraburkholderia youngii]|uniref:transcriptional regulator n=1 Tax=Paraburkholderia youngii TaxID=2782701 RepID=UPI001590A2A4|nr:YdaS family helix-turn-helix protein [Paraburkholderia youngii]NUX55950.1 helix-turn-helix domain-containing protein [Paraburkholderia youngii]